MPIYTVIQLELVIVRKICILAINSALIVASLSTEDVIVLSGVEVVLLSGVELVVLLPICGLESCVPLAEQAAKLNRKNITRENVINFFI